jgi:hypothetical protein
MPTVRLTWTDLNAGPSQEEEHRIYRSTTPFGADTLPSVLATVAADVEEYEDPTANFDTTYYYAVAAERGGVLAISFITVPVGAPSGDAGLIEYFLAKNDASQTLTVSADNEVEFDTEVYDTNTAFAVHRFTVKPGMDGFYAVLHASVVLSAGVGQDSYLTLQRSTDGGTSWEGVAAHSAWTPRRLKVISQVLLADADIYRVVMTIGATSQNIDLAATVQFGGIILEPIA